MLSDAQKVEYLPKFLCGEALEVVRRNRGCNFKTLMDTLEEGYGQSIRIAQACIEDLVSGPKLAPNDSAGLLNFAEKLNTATKVLTQKNEQEVSVATNLKRIANLPSDMIGKWQTENYKITSRGESARLKDIARFVKKQVTIKNDPVLEVRNRSLFVRMRNTMQINHRGSRTSLEAQLRVPLQAHQSRSFVKHLS